jgi:hypothetical protein
LTEKSFLIRLNAGTSVLNLDGPDLELMPGYVGYALPPVLLAGEKLPITDI